jgi:acyl carrier protein
MPEDTLAVVLDLYRELGLSSPEDEGAAGEDIELWDSLVHVQLAHAVEQRLAITLPDDLLVPLPGLTLGEFAQAAHEVRERYHP